MRTAVNKVKTRQLSVVIASGGGEGGVRNEAKTYITDERKFWKKTNKLHRPFHNYSLQFYKILESNLRLD